MPPTEPLSFVEPMLCGLFRPGKFVIHSGDWIAEEKFDGERLIFRRGRDEKQIGEPGFQVNACAWSRYGNVRELPEHIKADLNILPMGVYDGELLVPGGHSFNVKELGQEENLVYVIFDLLEFEGKELHFLPWEDRRRLLEQMYGAGLPFSLSEVAPINEPTDVDIIRDKVWERNGEGLILKHKSSVYRPGKRSKDWLKIKQILSAVTTVLGYKQGLNGPYSTVVVRDDDGVEVTVKTLNRDELARLSSDPKKFIGKRLVIEYQEKTPDGNYRHPRWNHWAEDHE